MRMLLVVAILSSPAPALADQASADRYIAEQWEKIAALRADNAKRDANQKALCARVGGVRIGLNAEGVRKSCWGSPLRVNVTTTATGDREQWVYDAGYVYMTGGVVTAIQTSR